ncbi:MAG TPA: phospholipid methyltransferase [Dokdonella sp.]
MSTHSDHAAFLRSWLRAPIRTGAIAPSGHRLVELAAAEITPAEQPVVELGAGTGAVTAGLVARGIAPHRLALVEANAEFAQRLRERYPGARVFEMDAAEIDRVEAFFPGERAGAFVSALPLSLLLPEAVERLLASVFDRHLRDGGAFLQLACSPRRALPRDRLDHLGLHVERVGWVWANLPPVGVYRVRRR